MRPEIRIRRFGPVQVHSINGPNDQLVNVFWRNNNAALQIKGPRSRALFSERNGYRRPLLKLCGWRLFVDPSH